MSLPNGYTQLAYIESTGTQYIDTGFVPNQDTRVVIKAKCPVSSSTNFLFGARTSSSSNQFMFAGSASGYYVSGYGSASKSYSAAYNSDSAIVIDKNKQTTTLTLSDSTSTSVSGTYATFSAPCNLVLFGCNTNGTVAKGKDAIFSCQIYDNGTLVRDYIPCVNASGVIGMWDDVNSVFYGNAGTGTFIGKIEGEDFPIGYTQLAYIESTGTQYIDTGVIGTSTIRVETKITWNAGRVFIGSSTADDATRCFPTFKYGNGNYFGYGYITTYQASTAVVYGTEYTIETDFAVGAQSMTVNGTVIKTTANENSFNNGFPLYLFAANFGGTVGDLGSFRCEYCKIYDNGVLVRDYIPCRNASGEAGLWDAVNSVFYTNAGSGEFTHNLIPAGDHNANIGGIAAAVESGTVLFGGVSREIASGTVLIGGVTREISFASTMYTVTVTSGEYSTYYAYASIDGSYVSSETSLSVEDSTEMYCRVRSEVTGSPGTISVNGTVVSNSEYTLTITGNTTIEYSYNWVTSPAGSSFGYGHIAITMS